MRACPLPRQFAGSQPVRKDLIEMHKGFIRQAGRAALLTLLAVIIAAGQEFRGSVTGKVTDP
jgi:hypothetical protein